MVLIRKFIQDFCSFVRTIKLVVLALYIGWVARRGYGYANDKRPIIKVWYAVRIYFLRRYFNSRENITLVCNRLFSAGTALDVIVAHAWFCEKMKINMKIESFNRTILQFFENNVLALTEEAERSDQKKIEFPSFGQHDLSHSLAYVGIFFISSEYGHRVISKLSVKEDLIKSANHWFDEHIQGDWVAVHYRGTDIYAHRETGYKERYRIFLEPYITYLKSVLNDKCSIFACSDQAQFIDKMKEVFPGRVFARDIKRSYDSQPLHDWEKDYVGENRTEQERDSLIDILILAKAELVYTTGSGLVDVARYFNPKIKIVSMDGRIIGRGKNNAPMPRKDLFDKLSIPLE